MKLYKNISAAIVTIAIFFIIMMAFQAIYHFSPSWVEWTIRISIWALGTYWLYTLFEERD